MTKTGELLQVQARELLDAALTVQRRIRDEEVRRRVEAPADTITQQHLLTVAVPHHVHNVVQHLGEPA